MKKDLYIVLISRSIQIGTLIATMKLLTAFLPPSEMGKYSILMTIISFFSLLFINPVGMFINRQLNTWNQEGNLWHNLQHAVIYLLIVVFLSICISPMVLYYGYAGNIAINIVGLVCLIGLTLFANTLNQTIIPAFNMLGLRKNWAVFTTITLWGSLFFSVVLMNFRASVEWWLIGQMGGNILASLLAMPIFYRAINTKWHVKKMRLTQHAIKPIIVFSVPVALAVLLNWVQFQSYRLILGSFCGMEFLGIFAAGYSVSSGLMGAFEATASSYFHPLFYRKLDLITEKERMDVWCGYAQTMISLTLYTIIFIAFMAEPLTHILLASQYWTATYFAIIGGLVEGARVIGNVYSLAAHATMVTKILLVPQIVGAVTLFSSVLLLQFISAQWLGLILILPAILYVTMMHVTIRRKLKSKINLRNVFFSFLAASMIGVDRFFKLIIGYPDGMYSDLFSLAISGMIYICLVYYSVIRSKL